MGRGHSPWVHHLVSRALPNMPLEAGGRSQVGRNCVASLASLFLCGSTALRQRVLRPQLKRDPLGRSHVQPCKEGRSACSERPSHGGSRGSPFSRPCVLPRAPSTPKIYIWALATRPTTCREPARLGSSRPATHIAWLARFTPRSAQRSFTMTRSSTRPPPIFFRKRARSSNQCAVAYAPTWQLVQVSMWPSQALGVENSHSMERAASMCWSGPDGGCAANSECVRSIRSER